MLLFAIELPDGTVYLLTAPNLELAVEEATIRSSVRPTHVWTFSGVLRRKVD